MATPLQKAMPIVLPILIGLLAMLLYATSIGYDFLGNWGDAAYVTNNETIQNISGANLADIWTNTPNTEYIPVTYMVYLIEHAIFGENTTGYHIVNILLHAINGILIFFIFRRISHSELIAGIVASLFIVHPLQIETVVWISQLKILLSSFFFLSAFYLHIMSSERDNDLPFVVIGIILFLLGVLSRAAIVLTPILFILYDILGTEQAYSRIIRRNAPFLVISLLGLGLLGFAVSQNDGLPQTTADGPIETIQITLWTIGDYFGSLLVPINLNNLYLYDIGEIGVQGYISIIVAIVAVIASIGLLILRPLGKLITPLGVAWFWVLLIPLLLIVPNDIARADRFLYLASIGFFTLIAALLAAIPHWIGRPEANYVVSGVGVLLVLVMGIGNLTRISTWENPETLWNDHLEDYEASSSGWLNLTNYYVQEGNFSAASESLTSLILAYDGNVPRSIVQQRADLASLEGDYVTAIQLYRNLISTNPDNSQIRTSLGVVLVDYGVQLYDAGNYDAALASYVEAIEYIPEVPVVHNNIGFTMYTLGNYEQALIAYSQAVQLNPNYATAWVNLGDTALNLGQFELARNSYTQAVNLDANLPARSASNYCLALAELGENAEVALFFCEQAVTAEPENGLYLGRSAHALLLYGDPQNALVVAEAAVRIDPTLVLNHRTYGDALALTGNIEGARQAYQAALAINPNSRQALQGLARLEGQ